MAGRRKRIDPEPFAIAASVGSIVGGLAGAVALYRAGGIGVRSITDANHHPASRPWIDKTWFSRCQDEPAQPQTAWESGETNCAILPRVGPGQGIDLGKERCKIGAI